MGDDLGPGLHQLSDHVVAGLAAFDFGQFFIVGTKNGGEVPVGRLLDVTFPGPAWSNGGELGTEASFFMIPVIVASFIYIDRRFPRARAR